MCPGTRGPASNITRPEHAARADGSPAIRANQRTRWAGASARVETPKPNTQPHRVRAAASRIPHSHPRVTRTGCMRSRACTGTRGAGEHAHSQHGGRGTAAYLCIYPEERPILPPRRCSTRIKKNPRVTRTSSEGSRAKAPSQRSPPRRSRHPSALHRGARAHHDAAKYRHLARKVPVECPSRPASHTSSTLAER